MGWVLIVTNESAEVSGLDTFLNLILQSLALLGRVSAVFVIPTLLPSVGVEGLVQNPPPLGRQGCVSREPDWSVPVVSASVIPLARPPLAVFLLLVLLSTGLCTGLVAKLSEFFQLHVLSSSLPQLIQAACTGCQQRGLDVGLSACDAWQRPGSGSGCSLPPC